MEYGPPWNYQFRFKIVYIKLLHVSYFSSTNAIYVGVSNYNVNIVILITGNIRIEYNQVFVLSIYLYIRLKIKPNSVRIRF
jgi:hypothetical protein